MREKLRSLHWEDNTLVLLDQRKLPSIITYLYCKKHDAVIEAIRTLAVRGAPAIGVAAAYGMVLAALPLDEKKESFKKEMSDRATEMKSARPTAVNLFWAVDEMLKVVYSAFPEECKKALLQRAQEIEKQDQRICNAIATHGSSLFTNRKKLTILTHCNTGALATAGRGTALGIIFKLFDEGHIDTVYANETRPLLQGARLTATELAYAGVPCTVLTDSMAAMALRDKKIDAIIVGADRIAQNGDTANKIGTYGLAVLAKYHNIPFYVAAPFSTFDFSITSGADITIEERDSDEVKTLCGVSLAPKEVFAMNPAFDVTPHELITGIITEKGVLLPPFREHISEYERSLS